MFVPVELELVTAAFRMGAELTGFVEVRLTCLGLR